MTWQLGTWRTVLRRADRGRCARCGNTAEYEDRAGVGSIDGVVVPQQATLATAGAARPTQPRLRTHIVELGVLVAILAVFGGWTAPSFAASALPARPVPNACGTPGPWTAAAALSMSGGTTRSRRTTRTTST